MIELSGSGRSNGCRLRCAGGSPWNNTAQAVIAWDLNYTEGFTVYVDVQTNFSRRYLIYTAVDTDGLGDNTYVRHGLGTHAADGTWRTFLRDLQADLAEAQPEAAIEAVNAFSIRGSGRVDDIQLETTFPAELDTDADGLTDGIG